MDNRYGLNPGEPAKTATYIYRDQYSVVGILVRGSSATEGIDELQPEHKEFSKKSKMISHGLSPSSLPVQHLESPQIRSWWTSTLFTGGGAPIWSGGSEIYLAR